MGAIISSIKGTLKTVKTIIAVLRDLNNQYNGLLARANTPPGLPVPNPTISFWQEDPPFPELVDIRSPTLPSEADVVIIGSGITGAAVARSLLKAPSDKRPESVVVLEARQICSGATGRNGGHIKASPHESFARLVKKMPGERAAALVRFQLSHLKYLTELCEAEGFDKAECREVESVDLFVDEESFTEAIAMLQELHRWVPEYEMMTWSAEAAREKFFTNESVVGAITYKAGALWPYRFVTSVWRKLLNEYPDALSVETGTGVESIEVASVGQSKGDVYPYKINTTRGVLYARHVVHATNAHASNLIPGLLGKMTGGLAHMSAQRPGKAFPDLDGSRSWSIMFGVGNFDYITQRPTVKGVPGEVMLGGGFFQAENGGIEMVGEYDDRKLDALTTAHLEGIMPTIFAPNWGDDGEGGRLKRVWSGVIAIAPDWRPFVGRLDHRITKRRADTQRLPGRTDRDVGEWISAAYIGDGMVWAWLCGTALGFMITGHTEQHKAPEPGRPDGALREWFPPELYATYQRIQTVDIADLADMVM